MVHKKLSGRVNKIKDLNSTKRITHATLLLCSITPSDEGGGSGGVGGERGV